ncbi:hypothetical protein [Gordonia aichiensis]
MSPWLGLIGSIATWAFAFAARDLLDTAVAVGTAVVIAARREAAALDRRDVTGDNESISATAQYRQVRA